MPVLLHVLILSKIRLISDFSQRNIVDNIRTIIQKQSNYIYIPDLTGRCYILVNFKFFLSNKVFYILTSFIFLPKIINKKADMSAIILPKINGTLTPI